MELVYKRSKILWGGKDGKNQKGDFKSKAAKDNGKAEKDHKQEHQENEKVIGEGIWFFSMDTETYPNGARRGIGLIILIALLARGGTPISGGGGTGKREIGSSAVYGTIVDAYPRVPPKGVIKLRSSNTGKVYTFYTGLKTRYSPVDRGPAIGDTAKIYYINDRGYLKATYVRLY